MRVPRRNRNAPRGAVTPRGKGVGWALGVSRGEVSANRVDAVLRRAELERREAVKVERPQA